MSATLREYLTAVATHLGSESPNFVWDPDGGYLSTDTGIFLKNIPLKPDRIVVIAGYLDELDLVLPSREIDFQVRVRGSQFPTNCDDMADEVIKLLHRQHRVTWNGLKIDRIRHLSTAILGPDEQGRWERADNYELLTQNREL